MNKRQRKKNNKQRVQNKRQLSKQTAKYYPALDAMDQLYAAKDMDEIQELIINLFNVYGVNTLEVAQLSFSLMWNTLRANSNKQLLKDTFNLNADELSIEDTLTIQQMLLESANG